MISFSRINEKLSWASKTEIADNFGEKMLHANSLLQLYNIEDKSMVAQLCQNHGFESVSDYLESCKYLIV